MGPMQKTKMHIKSIGFCKEQLKISLNLLGVFKCILYAEMEVRPTKRTECTEDI